MASYDAWKADDSQHCERMEGPEPPRRERSVPLYSLEFRFDRGWRVTIVRLLVQYEHNGAWRALDQASAEGDDESGALAAMRAHRRLLRGVL